MKSKFLVSIYVPCVAASICLSSCGDKKKSTDEKSSGAATPVEEKMVTAALATEAELSSVAGFSQHLAKDTELFFNAQNISGLVNAMRGSEIGQLISDSAKKEGEDLDEVMQSPVFQEFMKVAGEEVFFSMGDGSAKYLRIMGDMYGSYYEAYYYMIGKFMMNALEGGDMMNDPAQMMQMVGSSLKPVFDDFLEMEEFKMPTLYAGFKVSSESDRERYTKLIQETLAKALELDESTLGMENYFEADSVEAYGGFTGVKVDYSKLPENYSEEASAGLAMLGMDEDYMKKLKEKYKDLTISALAGSYGDYVVIYIGDSSEGLKFIEQPSDSLLANEEMSFLKEYKGKEVVSLSYVNEGISQELAKVSTVMQDLSAGVNKFLAETESFGDTSHIQALLKKMAANSWKKKSLTKPSRFGSVAYMEDGFKMDSFHGSDSAMYDLEAKRKLSTIAMREDAVLSSSWVVNEQNADLALQNMEDFVNLSYQVTKLVVDQEIDDPDVQEFADMFRMVDGQFGDDLLALWVSLRDGMRDGLGNEGAMVIDLKGQLPRIPGAPTVVLENGHIPRFAMGYDVADRSKLASSWEAMDATNREVVSKLEKLSNQKMNMMTPELSKKEGIDFWSYQLGITSHESNLALGLNDQMMFLNTSPAFVESFVGQYDADGTNGGMDFKVRLTPIRTLAQEWMTLANDHGDELSPGFDREEFEEAQVLINDVLKASEEVDSLDFSMRKQNGEVRSFLHLNKRD